MRKGESEDGKKKSGKGRRVFDENQAGNGSGVRTGRTGAEMRAICKSIAPTPGAPARLQRCAPVRGGRGLGAALFTRSHPVGRRPSHPSVTWTGVGFQGRLAGLQEHTLFTPYLAHPWKQATPCVWFCPGDTGELFVLIGLRWSGRSVAACPASPA